MMEDAVWTSSEDCIPTSFEVRQTIKEYEWYIGKY